MLNIPSFLGDLGCKDLCALNRNSDEKKKERERLPVLCAVVVQGPNPGLEHAWHVVYAGTGIPAQSVTCELFCL